MARWGASQGNTPQSDVMLGRAGFTRQPVDLFRRAQ
jgi:hypothetical protein